MAYVKYGKRFIYKLVMLSRENQNQMETRNTIEMGETVM